MILLLFSSFITCLLLSNYLFNKYNLREKLLISVLIFCLLFNISTELLSITYSLNTYGVLSFWVIITIIGFFLFLKLDKTKSIHLIKEKYKNLFSYIKNDFNNSEKILLFIFFIIYLGIIIECFAYPPNNNDSMDCHMARINYWYNNETLFNIQVNDLRQIVYPPFHSSVILHTILLSSSDLWANTIQFLLSISTILVITLISKELNFTLKNQILAGLLAGTIPEIILQSSSTQNDIVVAFFVICTIYFIIKIFKSFSYYNFIFLGISIGLSMYSKGIAYFYIFLPLFILLIYCIYNIIFLKKYSIIHKGILSILIILIINSMYFYRNYKTTNTFLGATKEFSKSMKNENLNMSNTLINLIKNTSLHFAPYPLSEISYKFVVKIFELLDKDINDNKNSFVDYKVPKRASHEDSAPNNIAIVLIIIMFFLNIIYFFKEINNLNYKFLFITFSFYFMYFVLAFYFKYQPWHTRLMTSFFYLSPIIIIFLSNYFKLNYIRFIYIIWIFYGFFIMLFNNSRPIISYYPITDSINIFDSREKKYFANRLDLYNDFSIIKGLLLKSENKIIGTDMESNEYRLFRRFEDKLIPIHINFDKNTIPFKNFIVKDTSFNLIVSYHKNDLINFNGNAFYLVKTDTKELFLYKKN